MGRYKSLPGAVSGLHLARVPGPNSPARRISLVSSLSFASWSSVASADPYSSTSFAGVVTESVVMFHTVLKSFQLRFASSRMVRNWSLAIRRGGSRLVILVGCVVDFLMWWCGGFFLCGNGGWWWWKKKKGRRDT